MPTLRVPPGRAGRLWLRTRLGVAERGVTLLEQKVAILGGERRRLRALAADTGRDWERACLDARTWTLRATLLGGQRSIQQATPELPAMVTVAWTTTMGIRYPGGAECTPPRQDEGVLVDSSALVYAQRAHVAAVAAAARHGAVIAAVRVIDREFHATRLRAMALRRHWVPNLRAALAKVELDLEEQERAEGIRLKSAMTLARTSERPTSSRWSGR
ncbi:MAG: V-type ATP synthase subunit D [Mycobacterium sp.]|nr:V-type ATP synthase subunit D [Mycobacterium sp.]